MTTITEILAEAFNRVKAEHGVTMSRVDFAPAVGAVGLSFKAAGCYMELRDTSISPEMPEGATHYGSLEGGNPRYYRYTSAGLFGWGGWAGWCKYVSLSDSTDAELVEQLTALRPINPTSKSASGSDS